MSLFQPLALVAWGCSLQLSSVDPKIVKKFIKERSMHGPEGKYAKLGKYTFGQLEKAVPPAGSDENDKIICPTS